MSFDRRDIRPNMDVYTKDNVYLGTVLRVMPGVQLPKSSAEGSHVPDTNLEGSTVSGELMGPMPTQTIGNTGPLRQAARERYASTPDQASLLGQGMLTVGKWYGLLGKHDIPFGAIQTVSLERVVLRLTRDEVW